jgi:4-hydroxy-4-methyl-2-oxoglutarate aldolase
LHEPIQFGGVLVRSGDIIVGNADGLVILDQDRLDEIYQAAVARRKKEADMMAELRQGKTTVELLGLPALVIKAGGPGRAQPR